MALLVLDPGLWTTVQDGGRPGFRDLGVPEAGAFDRDALALANALATNDPDAAALELTLRGGSYRATRDLGLALAGAELPARIENPVGPDRDVLPNSSFTLRAGECLILGPLRDGARAYLAVAGGGWRTPVVMGSRSSETPLRAGDQLEARPGALPVRRVLRGIADPDRDMLRILPGPDASRIAAGSSAGLEGMAWRVSSRSDRMGVRLDGPWIDLIGSDAERLSAPVWPGAVQVAGGHPIVLGAACGTLGGYPHVAQVITADLPVLAQLRPGSTARFRVVGLDEARAALQRSEARRRETWVRVSCAAGSPSRVGDDRV
jgi:biotin-dependent carboxylase-like uncharacterized protein